MKIFRQWSSEAGFNIIPETELEEGLLKEFFLGCKKGKCSVSFLPGFDENDFSRLQIQR